MDVQWRSYYPYSNTNTTSFDYSGARTSAYAWWMPKYGASISLFGNFLTKGQVAKVCGCHHQASKQACISLNNTVQVCPNRVAPQVDMLRPMPISSQHSNSNHKLNSTMHFNNLKRMRNNLNHIHQPFHKHLVHPNQHFHNSNKLNRHPISLLYHHHMLSNRHYFLNFITLLPLPLPSPLLLWSPTEILHIIRLLN